MHLSVRSIFIRKKADSTKRSRIRVQSEEEQYTFTANNRASKKEAFSQWT